MKVGDYVKVFIESGYPDHGVIVDSYLDSFIGELVYEVHCQENKKLCIATIDMLEMISEAG